MNIPLSGLSFSPENSAVQVDSVHANLPLILTHYYVSVCAKVIGGRQRDTILTGRVSELV